MAKTVTNKRAPANAKPVVVSENTARPTALQQKSDAAGGRKGGLAPEARNVAQTGNNKIVSKTQTSKSNAKSPVRAADAGEHAAQTERFNKAMALFHARDFRKARDLFAQASEGPAKEIVFAAKSHLRMCEQRLERSAPKPETPEDYYTLGVALTNSRRLDEARHAFEQALRSRETDHYHYGLSVCLALSGDADAAARHLARAIELQPANRTVARNDSDLAPYLQSPAIQAALNGAR